MFELSPDESKYMSLPYSDAKTSCSQKGMRIAVLNTEEKLNAVRAYFNYVYAYSDYTWVVYRLNALFFIYT